MAVVWAEAGSAVQMTHLSWRLAMDVVDKIINKGGTIFGEAVRDIYLHDSHTTRFYEAEEYTTRIIDQNATCADVYNDRAFLPQFAGRFTIPPTIDAMIHVSKYDSLIKALKEKFTITHVSTVGTINGNARIEHVRMNLVPISTHGLTRVIERYITDQLPGESAPGSAFSEAIFTFIDNIHNTSLSDLPCIKVDVYKSFVPLNKKQLEYPVNTFINFICNGLLLDANGIRLSSYLITAFNLDGMFKRTRFLQVVLSEIADKIARCIVYGFDEALSDVSDAYIQKMLTGKWEISYDYKNFCMIKDKYDGHCIICHEKFADADGGAAAVRPHYKMTCCDARFHEKCMMLALTNGSVCMTQKQECMLCNATLFSINSDSHILNAIISKKRSVLYPAPPAPPSSPAPQRAPSPAPVLSPRTQQVLSDAFASPLQQLADADADAENGSELDVYTILGLPAPAI